MKYTEDHRNEKPLFVIEEKLDVAYENIDEARILCAENLGSLGIESINSIIKNKVIKNTSTKAKKNNNLHQNVSPYTLL